MKPLRDICRKLEWPKWSTRAVPILLVVHASLLGYSATRHSPTHPEPALLASGLSHWQLARFDLYRVNPPLVRMVAAVPVMMAGCKTDWSRLYEAPGSRAEFPVGRDFITVNGERSIWLVVMARWACIPFSLIGGWFAWRWAGELYGQGAGLATLTLWTFEPNLLAHAELITSDAACTSFGIAAGYYFWKWLREPTYARAATAGVWLGFAQLAKMTWLILFPLWPAIWLVWICASRFASFGDTSRSTCQPLAAIGATATPTGCRRLVQMALMFVLAAYIINLGYGFDGTWARLGDLKFVSRLMVGSDGSSAPGNRFAQSFAHSIRLPLPKQYVLGFDAQKKDFEEYGRPAYLFGQWSRGGWWYYYLLGLLVKVPCGTWALLAIVLVSRFFRRGSRAQLLDEFALLAPAVAVAAVASWQSGINHHLRYIFPALGLLLIVLGQAFRPRLFRWRLTAAIPFAAISYAIISAASVYPHHLAYFNDFIGGPRNGHRYLLGSNLDWGQDLLLLRNWCIEHRSRVTAFIGGPEHAVYTVLREDARLAECPGRDVRIASTARLFSQRQSLKATGERIGWTLWVVE